MQMTLDMPLEMTQFIQAEAKKTGKNQQQVVLDLVANAIFKNQIKEQVTTEQMGGNKSTYSKYEEFNFDLQRMDSMLDTDFVEVPSFDNRDDLIDWIESGA